MNGHETIRAMLPLAAAGALTRGDLAAVEQHAATCSLCARELEVLRLYSEGLRDLPRPMVPAGLMQRTTARLVQERAAAAGRRRQDLTLGALALFSWSLAAVSWILVRVFTGGVWIVLGANLADAGTWFLASALLAWTTAGVAVVALGKHHALVRRIL